MARDDYAIVVGVSAYPSFPPPLEGPENDARAFRDWLVTREGGAVPKRHVTLVVSSDFPPSVDPMAVAEPTRERVEAAVNRYFSRARANARKRGGRLWIGRRLYLYFAGHGIALGHDDAALLMANATREQAVYHVLGQYTAQTIRYSGIFDEVLLFMECCREFPSPTPPRWEPYTKAWTAPDAAERVKFLRGFATKHRRTAYGMGMKDGLVHGVFTTALIEGLEGLAADPDDPGGHITAASLESYFYNGGMKKRLSPDAQANPEIPDEPDISVEKRFRDSLIIARAIPKPRGVAEGVTRPVRRPATRVPTFTVKVHLPSESVGRQLELFDDQFNPIVATAAAPPLWQVQLKRGSYFVTIADLGREQPFDVDGVGVDGAGTVDVTL